MSAAGDQETRSGARAGQFEMRLPCHARHCAESFTRTSSFPPYQHPVSLVHLLCHFIDVHIGASEAWPKVT